MENERDNDCIKSLNRHILEQIVAASSAAVVVADASRPDFPVAYANPAYERLTGYSAAELVGQPWAVLAGTEHDRAGLADFRAALGRGEPCRLSVAGVRKDGGSFTSDVEGTPLTGPRGDLRYFLFSHASVVSTAAHQSQPDTTSTTADSTGELLVLQRELGQARQKIATLDRIDPATGLMRFSYFQETLRRDLAIARRDRRFVTVLVFEIVEFDVYRQTFGDKAADSCQRMIGAQIMRALRRAGDLCARYDDATMVAAVVGQHSDDVRPLAERIADSVQQLKLHNPRAKSSRYVATRVLVIGCPPGAHDDPEPLIARALAEAHNNNLPLRAIRA